MVPVAIGTVRWGGRLGAADRGMQMWRSAGGYNAREAPPFQPMTGTGEPGRGD